jgi:hypothetical protein
MYLSNSSVQTPPEQNAAPTGLSGHSPATGIDATDGSAHRGCRKIRAFLCRDPDCRLPVLLDVCWIDSTLIRDVVVLDNHGIEVPAPSVPRIDVHQSRSTGYWFKVIPALRYQRCSFITEIGDFRTTIRLAPTNRSQTLRCGLARVSQTALVFDGCHQSVIELRTRCFFNGGQTGRLKQIGSPHIATAGCSALPPRQCHLLSLPRTNSTYG